MWVGLERSTLCASANEELGTLPDNKNTSKGNDNHVDVVETNQPSETASTMWRRRREHEHGETCNRGMATDTQSIRAEHNRNDQWVTLTRPR